VIACRLGIEQLQSVYEYRRRLNAVGGPISKHALLDVTSAPASRKSSIFLGRIVGVMFMRVNSMCAHQVRPPLNGMKGGRNTAWSCQFSDRIAWFIKKRAHASPQPARIFRKHARGHVSLACVARCGSKSDEAHSPRYWRRAAAAKSEFGVCPGNRH